MKLATSKARYPSRDIGFLRSMLDFGGYEKHVSVAYEVPKTMHKNRGLLCLLTLLKKVIFKDIRANNPKPTHRKIPTRYEIS